MEKQDEIFLGAQGMMFGTQLLQDTPVQRNQRLQPRRN
jgi:hypothetical protein